MNETVRVTGIDMSIGQLVLLFLKMAVAAIPALILLSLFYMAVVSIFMFAFWPATESG